MDHESEGRGAGDSALLVALQFPGDCLYETEASLAELHSLTENMGLSPADTLLARVRGPSPRFLAGTGKAEEIRVAAENSRARYIVFDNELSPSQQRNWEQFTGLCVIDRREVILQIFADRAMTREAQLQVELARMEYSLPRLTRAWTHLSRQRGGARGTRGEGETQLELDRRRVLARIDKAKALLKKVRKQRQTQRSLRERAAIKTGAIVGYTNAGKSSLLRALSGGELYVADKLFATLDPATRRVRLSAKSEILLTDTVGFIRRLPHELIEAFKSTLEETVLADFLVHVLDASDPHLEERARTTRDILGQIGAAGKPVISVFNKIDLCADPAALRSLAAGYPNPAFVSASSGAGAGELRALIAGLVHA
ncbi:MAG: GTPase HflX [Spirochaetia bacterium]|jgi:GTP-binding protein HflX|nr:GTPase HflX [Spirochaetia bacterium]